MGGWCATGGAARQPPPWDWAGTWQPRCWRRAAAPCWRRAGRRAWPAMADQTLLAARPLAGRRIVVPRAQEQASGLVADLRALGAEPLECPAIAVVPPDSYAPLDAAIHWIAQYDWIIFTSVNGVAAFV